MITDAICDAVFEDRPIGVICPEIIIIIYKVKVLAYKIKNFFSKSNPR